MDNLRQKYEDKFNIQFPEVGINKSWEYLINYEPTRNKDQLIPYERYNYSISQLYGHVLDIGSADGYGAYLMSKNPKIKTITCIEIQDLAIEKAKKNLKGIENVTIIKGIGEDIPFKEPFDSIHCGATLEHVFDDRKVLSEIKRLLKGIAIICVPIAWGTDKLVHIREYKSEKEFMNLLGEYFEVIKYKTYTRKDRRITTVVTVKNK